MQKGAPVGGVGKEEQGNIQQYHNLNDPFAGSPTKTVLRLYLFLGHTIYKTMPTRQKNISAHQLSPIYDKY